MRKVNLKTVFTIITFGALWGIIEATLGTLLHLPFISKAGIFACSSTIIVPLAFLLMSNCYKKTGTLLSLPFMGVVAASLKLLVGLFLGFTPSVYNPAIYIVLESLCMMSALAIFKPTNVVSLKTFVSVVVASTLYQASYLLVNMAMGGTNIFSSLTSWVNVGEKYLFKVNCIAIMYSLVVGSISYGVISLCKKYDFNTKFDINKLVSSPVTACICSFVAVTLTISLSLL